jgi:spore germination protein KC
VERKEKNAMKAISKWIALFLCISNVLLTGCYDAREVDDEVYTISIGMDKGVDNKIRLTIQYPTYRGGSNSSVIGGSDGENLQENNIIHTLECPSIVEGIDMMGMSVSRRVSLMHTKMLVFSEELAREGVGNFVSAIQRFRESRSTMAIVVVKGVTAENFIKENKSNIGGTISKVTELMFLQAKYSNYFPYIKFRDFYKDMLSPYKESIAIYGGVNDFNNLSTQKVKDPPLVTKQGFKPGELPRKGVAKREYTGIAVFNGDKMVGALDSYETSYYLMIMGKFPKGAVTFEDPADTDKAIVLDMRNNRKPKVKAYLRDGKPVIDLEVQLEADIETIQSRINYENRKGLQILNEYTAKLIQEDMRKLIKKTQKEYRSDIFGFGRFMAAKFPTIQDFEKFNWLNQYGDAEINVKTTVEIRRSGTMFRSSKIQNGLTEDTILEKGDSPE